MGRMYQSVAYPPYLTIIVDKLNILDKAVELQDCKNLKNFKNAISVF